MKNKKGNVAVIATIIVIVAITAGVVGWMFAKKKQAPVQQTVVAQPTVSVQQAQPVVQPVVPAQIQDIVYKNNQFGFQLTLPKGFEKYKAITITNTGSKNVLAYVYIDLPTSDKTWPGDEVDQKTGARVNAMGFASMAAVTVWSIDGFQTELKRCKTEPDPGCPSDDPKMNYLKNDKYVFDMSFSQVMPPSDVANLGNIGVDSLKLIAK